MTVLWNMENQQLNKRYNFWGYSLLCRYIINRVSADAALIIVRKPPFGRVCFGRCSSNAPRPRRSIKGLMRKPNSCPWLVVESIYIKKKVKKRIQAKKRKNVKKPIIFSEVKKNYQQLIYLHYTHAYYHNNNNT